MKAQAEAMQRFTGPLFPFLAAVLVGVAFAGFVLGHHRAGATAVKPRIAAGSGILLEYPSTWRPAPSAPAIPGLAIDGQLVLAPGGNAAGAGLLSGRLSAGQPAPLPAGFVRLLLGLPRTEVVDLTNAQAYRYREVHLQGYARSLELYVIPNAVEGPSVLVCYANSESSAFMQQCGQTVAQITLPGQSLFGLSPNGDYAAQLGKLLGNLQRQRLALREEMQMRNSPAQVATLAAALAQQFASAAASIRTLEPPQSADAAQAALAASLLHGHAAYQALAAAAASASSSQVDAAQARLSSAEAELAEGEVDSSLENYALLGYGHM
jgi:hypothetical protein